MTTRIGDATITGASRGPTPHGGARTLGADLEADRLDFVQVRALAELLGGRDLERCRLTRRQLRDQARRGRTADRRTSPCGASSVDAGFANGELTVNGIDDRRHRRRPPRRQAGKIADVLTRAGRPAPGPAQRRRRSPGLAPRRRHDWSPTRRSPAGSARAAPVLAPVSMPASTIQSSMSTAAP